MGIFGWLKPEEEGDRIVGEISNSSGDHVVFDIPAEDEGKMRRLMRENKVSHDSAGPDKVFRDAEDEERRKDPDKNYYSMKRVDNPTEDLEPEEDDDSVTERDEQPARGWWW